jgi:hypothetical protein
MHWPCFGKRRVSGQANLQKVNVIDIRISSSVGMNAKSAYSLVQQTRLDNDPLSRKAEIANHRRPCGLFHFTKSIYIDILNMSNRNIID